MRLIRQFPLKPLRTDEEHSEAVEIVGQFIGRKLDGGAGDYLDTLILLVNEYEDKHHSTEGTPAPQQALRAIKEPMKRVQE